MANDKKVEPKPGKGMPSASEPIVKGTSAEEEKSAAKRLYPKKLGLRGQEVIDKANS